jgi:hypothetical protein
MEGEDKKDTGSQIPVIISAIACVFAISAAYFRATGTLL